MKLPSFVSSAAMNPQQSQASPAPDAEDDLYVPPGAVACITAQIDQLSRTAGLLTREAEWIASCHGLISDLTANRLEALLVQVRVATTAQTELHQLDPELLRVGYRAWEQQRVKAWVASRLEPEEL